MNDTIVIDFLQLKAKVFIKMGIFDSASVNLEKARSLAIFSSNTQAQVSIDIHLGSLMLDNGNLRSSEKYLWEAVEILDQGQDQDKKGEAYNLYGSLLADRGDILKSQQYLFKAFACFENGDEFSTISRICNNIASNYKAQGSRNEALSYYRKALDYAIKAKDTMNISSAYNNIGIFYRTSQPDSALIFYKRSLSLLYPGEKSLMEIITRYNIANLYFDQKEYETAKADYLHLLEVCRKGKNVGGVARINISLAAYYSKNDRYPEAKRYLTDAIALSDSIGDKRIHNYALNELKDLYIKTKDYKYALDLTLMIKKNGDSTLVAEKRAAVHEIELLYESEKKDAENARLKYEVSSQQTALKYRMVIILLFILSTIVMLFLIRILTKLNKQRSLAYQQLVNKYKLESELGDTGQQPIAGAAYRILRGRQALSGSEIKSGRCSRKVELFAKSDFRCSERIYGYQFQCLYQPVQGRCSDCHDG
ncbi:MAG: tetratricopeptide repeat protein [Bacteroidetes bacterium]|nr:tetratricopeptide repeat protein [Bacteroidota bacterium]